MTLRPRPLVIGIAGPSGSGKTAIARELRSLLNATLLPLDAFYRDLSHLTPAERGRHNFDHPDALDTELLVAQLGALRAGQAICRPCYSFSTHTRSPETLPVEPASVLLVEGILALHFPELRALYDLSVFVRTPDAICLARRLARDVRERDRTESSVQEQYTKTARPMAERFVLPSQVHATLTVDGTGSLDGSVEIILRELRFRNLLP